jgi:hypothetical protein
MANKIIFSLMCCTFLGACGDDARDTGLSTSILPVLDAATPLALQTAAAKKFSIKNQFMSINPFANATTSAVITGINYLFDTTYPNINGDNVEGFFRSAIKVIDDRASLEGATLSENYSAQCQNGAAYTPAITALAADSNLTVNPACLTVFSTGGSNVAGAGSGYAYGETTEDDGTISVTSWLTLVQSNSIDKFAMMGKITNAAASSDSEKGAEVLFMEAGPSGGSWNRHTLYHIKAQPSTSQYEFTAASTSAGVMQAPTASSDVTGFGCGFQMISNGEFIRAKGRQVLTGTCTGVTDGDFDVCLKADDLTEAASGSCSTLTFTMTGLTSALFSTTTQTEMAAALMVEAATSANDVSTLK